MCDAARLSRQLKGAVAKLYQRDDQLIDGRGHEQTITAHLARYLGEELPTWNIDCEYNRDGRDRRDVKRDQHGAAMRPDIVVHRRRNTENLLAVELKPSWSASDRTEDFEKLEHLTGDRFKYRLGAHVELGRNEATFLWYMHARRVDDPDG
jgi:hypothetical protein